MKKLALFGIIAAGYIAAFLLASVALHFRQIATPDAQVQASAGMYAFGDSIYFSNVFGVLALFPTGLALYCLRPFRAFWNVFSILSLSFAIAGLVCAGAVALSSTWQHPPVIMVLVTFFGVLLLLGSPLFTVMFLLCALFAPVPRPRWMLLATAGLEGLLVLYLLYRFFIPMWFPS